MSFEKGPFQPPKPALEDVPVKKEQRLTKEDPQFWIKKATDLARKHEYIKKDPEVIERLAEVFAYYEQEKYVLNQIEANPEIFWTVSRVYAEMGLDGKKVWEKYAEVWPSYAEEFNNENESSIEWGSKDRKDPALTPGSSFRAEYIFSIGLEEPFINEINRLGDQARLDSAYGYLGIDEIEKASNEFDRYQEFCEVNENGENYKGEHFRRKMALTKVQNGLWDKVDIQDVFVSRLTAVDDGEYIGKLKNYIKNEINRSENAFAWYLPRMIGMYRLGGKSVNGLLGKIKFELEKNPEPAFYITERLMDLGVVDEGHIKQQIKKLKWEEALIYIEKVETDFEYKDEAIEALHADRDKLDYQITSHSYETRAKMPDAGLSITDFAYTMARWGREEEIEFLLEHIQGVIAKRDRLSMETYEKWAKTAQMRGYLDQAIACRKQEVLKENIYRFIDKLRENEVDAAVKFAHQTLKENRLDLSQEFEEVDRTLINLLENLDFRKFDMLRRAAMKFNFTVGMDYSGFAGSALRGVLDKYKTNAEKLGSELNVLIDIFTWDERVNCPSVIQTLIGELSRVINEAEKQKQKSVGRLDVSRAVAALSRLKEIKKETESF